MIGLGGYWLGGLHYISSREKIVEPRQDRDHLKEQIEEITRLLSSVRRKTNPHRAGLYPKI
jgi:hypothetical protein